MAVIYCFGDSITYGAWDIENAGWSTQLRNYLDKIQEKDESKYFLTYNLGIPGETSEGFLVRFETELAARAKAGRGPAGPGEAIFIFAFGANDYVYIPSKNAFVVSPEKFKANMQKSIDIAKKSSSKIVLLNITPADEAICKKNYGDRKLRLNKNVEDFNKVLADLATDNTCELVDVYNPFISKGMASVLSEDGLHPNEVGHKLIFEIIKTTIDKLI